MSQTSLLLSDTPPMQELPWMSSRASSPDTGGKDAPVSTTMAQTAPTLARKSSIDLPLCKRMRPTYRREATDNITTLGCLRSTKDSPLSEPLLSTESRDRMESKDRSQILVTVIHEDEAEVLRDCKADTTALISWRTATLLLTATSILQAILLFTYVWAPPLPKRPATDFAGLPPRRPTAMKYGYALQAYPNGTMHPSTSSPYAGPPSPAINEAWNTLIGQRYFRLSESEAKNLGRPFEPLPLWPGAVEKAGYYAGIDMLHSLHCVNSLRVALDNQDEEMLLLPGEDRSLHLNHCIEQLRQAILCHADATPVTLKPVISEFVDDQGRKRRILTMLGETEHEHTCADNGMELIDWVRKMAVERGSV